MALKPTTAADAIFHQFLTLYHYPYPVSNHKQSIGLVGEKKCCRAGEGKYDFSKIVALKGGSGRDATKKGRPPGFTSGLPSKTTVTLLRLHYQMQYHTVVDDSTTERLLTSEEIYSSLLKGSDGLFMTDNTYQTCMLQDLDKDMLLIPEALCKSQSFILMDTLLKECVCWNQSFACKR
ncbi:hypothetical protein ACJMK2_037011 [Sinanodonta woodiana]|uniref:Uncharacterized protein n=1 Tax=Sinanodonta woodiana TaxID=1069815 RepID=A0ABD3WIY5_SINWO